MKAVVIGSDFLTTNFATLAVRLCWPDVVPVVAANGAMGIASVAEISPDLVLLHPDFTDMELAEIVPELRQLTQAPLLVLGCQDDQTEVVTALTLGADHYVKLPCDIAELTARIWATLRRTSVITTAPEQALLRSGPTLLDLTDREALPREQAVYFTPTEFHLLQKLLENNGPATEHRTPADAWL